MEYCLLLGTEIMGLVGENKIVGGELCDPLKVGAQLEGKL